MPQSTSSYNASTREGRSSRPPISGRPSQMQVALSGHHSNEPSRTSTSGHPSQMQNTLPDPRNFTGPPMLAPGRLTTARPSELQVALVDHQYDVPASSSMSRRSLQTSGATPSCLSDFFSSSSSSTLYRPSQMQVALPEQRNVELRHSAPPRNQTVRSHGLPYGSRLSTALPSIYEAEISPYDLPARDNRSARPTEPYRGSQSTAHLASIRESNQNLSELKPTRTALQTQVRVDRPRAGVTRIVQPGEPHHFGSRTDFALGELICTLCRCSDPESHGDAYTMLNSPRGRDIRGHPIDWQEAKRRMLDWHGRDQISHADEISAIPYVFDTETSRRALEHEDRLRAEARNGRLIEINTTDNNVNWHTQDGHAKPYLTEEGAKTQFTRGGRGSRR